MTLTAGPRVADNTEYSVFGQLKPNTTPAKAKEITEMLLYEELTRARIRDLEDSVRGERGWRFARPSHRRTWVARWASRQPRQRGR